MKVRDAGAVRVKAACLALGINLAGEKELPGLWIYQTEGAKFWLQVVTELKNRGMPDVFIACAMGSRASSDIISLQMSAWSSDTLTSAKSVAQITRWDFLLAQKQKLMPWEGPSSAIFLLMRLACLARRERITRM